MTFYCEEVELESVCSRITVGWVGPMADRYVSNGIPFLRSLNIAPFRLLLDDVKFIPGAFHQDIAKSALKPGDVAVVRTGNPGIACVIPESLSDANCSDLVVITPGPRLNSYYLAAIFNSAFGQAAVSGQLVGVAQQHFNIGSAKKLKVALPPRPVQDRIALILCAYDDLIENNRKRIAILEEMARRLYREWFVHFRYPGHESVPVVDSPLGRFPQGWEIVPLHAAVCLNPRPALGSAPIPFIPMNCLSNDSMLIDGIEEREEPTGSRFQNGDTLLARITPCLENGKTAFVQCLVDGQAACGSTEFIVMRSLRLSPEIVYLLARSDEFRGIAIKSMSGATGRQRVQESSLSGFKIPCPPADICSQFSNLAAPFFKLCENLHRQTQVLRRTRDLLLPRLMSGQLAVEAAEAAVP